MLTRATSPLSEFRSHFADDAFDEVLFRIEPVGELPERIRIATLTSYDGELYRALDVASSTADARFTRVPSRLAAEPGEPISARITIEGLRGIWMPTAGAADTGRVRGDGCRGAGRRVLLQPQHGRGGAGRGRQALGR